MMPAATYQIPGGAKVLVFTCEVCGASASHGYGCTVLAALRTGDVKKAGAWYCAEHRPTPSPSATHEEANHGLD